MKKLMAYKKWAVALAIAVVGLSNSGRAQVLMSGGTYTQNFDTLSLSGNANPWADNSTIPGWYAASALKGVYTTYIATNGAPNNGALYSFGTTADSDRALGSASSGTPGTIGYGVRFQNDTTFAQTNITISYTAEQWRNGGNATAQPLTFYYRIDNTAITSPEPADTATWTEVAALDFTTPTTGTTAGALNGNVSSNRVVFSNVVLPNVIVLPGQEIFLRWIDINDAGADHGMGIDDLTVSYTATTATGTKPSITIDVTNSTVPQGGSASFTVTASGTQPLSYQWYLTNSSGAQIIDGATGSSYSFPYVKSVDSGNGYFVTINNDYGSATSSVGVLTVVNVPAVVTNIAYLKTLVNAKYVLTNTTTLFQIEGVVTTPGNLVSSPGFSFFMQDDTGGIDVFYRNNDFAFPALGDKVRVTTTLDQFNGVLEMHGVVTNESHSIQVVSSGNPLPEPELFSFSSPVSVATMESLEGSYMVISNVYLTLTNADGIMTAGGTIFVTNLTGQKFTLSIPSYAAADPVGYPLPSNPSGPPYTIFASSVKGVMTQFDSSATPTNNYSLYLSLMADITVGTPPPPSVSLSVRQVGTSVEISWPATASGTLESTTTLTSPNWQPAGSPTQVGDNNVVTISNPSGNAFFRLHQ